jgi:hypothetical protein
MKQKIEELKVVKATTGWLQNAADVMRKAPIVQYEKLPALSIQPDVAVAVKCVAEVRETTSQGKDYAWLDVELIEPALVYTKTEGEYSAPKGTKASMNLKRHAGLYRNFKRLFPEGKSPVDVEIVIANLGKRTFKTDKTASGKATGFDYRIMLLAELKKQIEETAKKKK